MSEFRRTLLRIAAKRVFFYVTALASVFSLSKIGNLLTKDPILSIFQQSILLNSRAAFSRRLDLKIESRKTAATSAGEETVKFHCSTKTVLYEVCFVCSDDPVLKDRFRIF